MTDTGPEITALVALARAILQRHAGTEMNGVVQVEIRTQDRFWACFA